MISTKLTQISTWMSQKNRRLCWSTTPSCSSIPFYWYSTPALIKQWEDLVLQHGWAYGHEGKRASRQTLDECDHGGWPANRLSGREATTATRSTELLRPIEQTARLCGMTYLPPFIVYGTHAMKPEEAEKHAAEYRQLLAALARGETPSRRGELRMHGQGFFFQAFVYLAAAVVAVPLAKRLGLGSVLGYLIAGMIIGPFGLELIGEEGQDVMHFAEFGVVMMLFLIGLELQPALLWRMRGPILGMGGLQVLLSAAAIAGVGSLVGLAWNEAIAVGLILALSSTAIVLQTLAEKGLMNTDGGQSAFAVLLFQDISVIPMLAALPLLAVGPVAEAVGHNDHGGTLVDDLPAWGQTLSVLLAVVAIVVGGRYLIRPVFRFIAQTRQTEVFTAAALLLVIGIALLMAQVGLSPALGTFLAGVVLAESEYRHELEADIEPFKGLLLGVFFIAVGASVDFALILAEPGSITAIVGALVAIKLLVLLAIGRVFGMGQDQNLLFLSRSLREASLRSSCSLSRRSRACSTLRQPNVSSQRSRSAWH